MQAVARTAGTSRSDAREKPKRPKNREASVPMQSTGADRLVLRGRLVIGAGAKGSGQAVACRSNWKQEDSMRVTDGPYGRPVCLMGAE